MSAVHDLYSIPVKWSGQMLLFCYSHNPEEETEAQS